VSLGWAKRLLLAVFVHGSSWTSWTKRGDLLRHNSIERKKFGSWIARLVGVLPLFRLCTLALRLLFPTRRFIGVRFAPGLRRRF
jgi:hypothetical protein